MLRLANTTLFIFLLVSLSVFAQTRPSATHAALTGALLCKGDPLETVRSLSNAKSRSFEKGFAGFSFGEDMGEINVLVLRSPLTIAGAKTSGVVMQFGTSYFNFNALVFGVFEGDPERVAAKLGLKPTEPGSAGFIGEFQKRLGADLKSDWSDTCPKTIALTPLREKNRFVMGCGWCNG
jgi:hypothetical protein